MRHSTRTTPVVRTRKPSLLSRLTRPRPATATRAPRARRTYGRKPRTVLNAPATTTVTHHHRRKPSMGDRISGALLKLKGTLTGRPGQKAAGTRRMRGTDGRGAHSHVGSTTTTTTTRRRRW
ncbi:hypothetical protein BZA05DRAFT_476942 [Tricharina praecox]|uniref:uncharacterized protein n=1 Tax=Tricharina praecox TaxID=43433 RepID=UPI002220306E|nr:uncharacterized protein BZA05DRAFT_476942 [Tricharina praecox]KAI5844080.1 hypothetical protein BZA05DRAFT_476942 [Tricharina praecox]